MATLFYILCKLLPEERYISFAFKFTESSHLISYIPHINIRRIIIGTIISGRTCIVLLAVHGFVMSVVEYNSLPHLSKMYISKLLTSELSMPHWLNALKFWFKRSAPHQKNNLGEFQTRDTQFSGFIFSGTCLVARIGNCDTVLAFSIDQHLRGNRVSMLHLYAVISLFSPRANALAESPIFPVLQKWVLFWRFQRPWCRIPNSSIYYYSSRPYCCSYLLVNI